MDSSRPPVEDRLRALGAHSLGSDPAPDAVEDVLRRWAASLDGTDPLRVKVERDALAKLPGVTAGKADAALEARRPSPGDEGGTYALQTVGPGVVEIVRRSDGSLAWLVVRDGDPDVVDEIEAGRVWPEDRIPWPCIPDADAVLQAVREGAGAPIEELATYINGRAILPKPRYTWALLLAAWTCGTYRLEDFDYYPLPLAVGLPERGKTRAAKAACWPAFRTIYVPSPTEATIFRDRARHRATLLLDVEDLGRVLERTGIGDLLLNGFERDGRVPRCTRPDAPPVEQVEYFDAYGASFLVANDSVRASSPLASRCVPLTMPEAGGRPIPPAARADDPEVADFRARLTAWRARSVELPDVPVPFTGRMADLARPLLQVLQATAPGLFEEMVGLLVYLDADRKREQADSWEARVAEGLWKARKKVEAGRLYLSDLADVVNRDRPDEKKLTNQQIGVARKKLGLQKGKGGARSTTYVRWPGEEEIKRLRDRYRAAPLQVVGEKGSGCSGSSVTRERMRVLGRETLRNTRNTPLEGVPPQNPDETYKAEHPEQAEHPDEAPDLFEFDSATGFGQ